MRSSKYLLSTLRETPKNIKMISHKLMIKSGMIRKLSSGLYIWLPTGLKVLHKIKKIIKIEMEKIGFMEIVMPIMQPSSLWKESGRLLQYNQELFQFFDRNNKSFVLGPTHEEMITNLVQNEIHSHKNLPLRFYQIHTKFRDEIRPKFGVIRSKEFIMKDAYSFHIDQKSLEETYNKVYNAYYSIFNRMGLKFQVTQADSGFIGGKISHEFQALNNHKKCESSSPFFLKKQTLSFIKDSLREKNFQKNIILLKDRKLIYDFSKENFFLIDKILTFLLKIEYTQFSLKSLDFEENCQGKNFLQFLIRHFKHILDLKDNQSIFNFLSNLLNSINQISENKKYFFKKNWDENFHSFKNLNSKKEIIKNYPKNIEKISQPNKSENIEIGHIFQIGTKYSKIRKLTIKDKNNAKCFLVMGCYGIGVTRTIAAIVEQNHDKEGILWPNQLSPFDVCILPIDMHKSANVQATAKEIYFKLKNHSVDVLFDDRKEYFGIMLSDTFLIGIPHILIISKKNLKYGKIEYKNRKDNINCLVSKEKIIDFLSEKINFSSSL